jgi:hypothetical protein
VYSTGVVLGDEKNETYAIKFENNVIWILIFFKDIS